MAINASKFSDSEFRSIDEEVDKHKGLSDVLSWAATKPKGEVHPQIVAEVIAQDEYTHDVIVPYRNVFLVYDTT
jgi:hypothetical protein